MPRPIIDLHGQTFGRLTVLHLAGQTIKGRAALWMCQCTCGNVITVRSDSLRSSNGRSCGCLKIELARERALHDPRFAAARKIKHHDPVWQMYRKLSGQSQNPRNGHSRPAFRFRSFDGFQKAVAKLGRCPDGFVLGRQRPDDDWQPNTITWVPDKKPRCLAMAA